MAYRKSSFKRKRTFKRRRKSYRKKGRGGGKPKYDGAVAIQMKVVKTFTQGASTVTGFGIIWGDQTAALGSTNWITLKDSVEWARYIALYRYFKVNYVKMEYHPTT